MADAVEGSPAPAATVLFIDDEHDSRLLVKLLLERQGYRVLTAGHGKDGLVLAKLDRPHVILLDVMMPDLDGYGTLRRLKDDPDTASIPVIMLTARRAERDIEASFRLGAILHLEKPYPMAALIEKIHMALVLATQQAPSPPSRE
jgi:CheY-like chemotaxis protein